VDQARAEARATEAAAEQREAAALALERAELVKQARGCPLHCPGLFLRTVLKETAWSRSACHAMACKKAPHDVRGRMSNGDAYELQCMGRPSSS